MKQTILDITLPAKFLVLHGPPAEAAGAVLRGCVILRVKEAVKLRSLTLELRGKVDVKWAPVISSKPDTLPIKKTVLNSSLIILEPREHFHTIPIGETKYEFEFPFNGNLPETVHTDHGHIHYSLKAVAERSFLLRNIVARKDVLVKRFSSTNRIEDTEPLSLMRVFNSDAACNVSIPKKAYGLGETFPIRFQLIPFMESIHATRVTCKLNQTVSYGDPRAGKLRSFKKERVVASQELEGDELILPVKISSQGVFYPACSTDYICNEHEMSLKIDFIVKGRHEVGYIRFPFTIAAESSDEFFDVLPPYTSHPPGPITFTLPSDHHEAYEVGQIENDLPSYEACCCDAEPSAVIVLPAKN
ncbi:hypothetical protein K493DRAFT_339466 [Basidiobolus meristosporus CBS 931.73]|uniref:Uncharacterized protein n=1 Tax=Basidiobolus meristosporus CBS 931.73 TaxID=1314790 RepID=A0A1Y1XZV2_9FUNG|nr:hypothetical protein K493DRAFT_339466 [Basidiobolus meristosporus CBS 931.73]|eukprot:ORX91272.1 hypothetical protein K493DRAFT_339466 [Basidiobolus meristosporus CBS 931.73]